MEYDQTPDPMVEGLRALLPPGYSKTLGFLIPAHEISQTLIDWYENEHAVNASFMWPHMRRYQRNYIMNVERGPVPLYRVVSEFVWKGEEDKRTIAALYATPAAAKTVQEVLPDFIIVPFPPESFFLLPVEEKVALASNGRVYRHDEPRQRKIVLLRRPEGERLEAFEAAVMRHADLLAGREQHAAVSIDFRREGQAVSAPADAILFVDAEHETILPEPEPAAGEVVNVFNVLTLRSPIEEI